MKIGSLKIPDYVTTDEGELIRSVDLVSAIRGEFRDFDYLISLDYIYTLATMKRACREMRMKYKQYYFHLDFLALMGPVWSYYQLTGKKQIYIRDVSNHFLGGLSFKWFRFSVVKYRKSGLIHKKWRRVIILTDDGIAAMKIFEGVLARLILENKEDFIRQAKLKKGNHGNI